jgi:hypothetical protein
MSIHAIAAVENAVRCAAGPGEACSIDALCQGSCAARLPGRPSDELILQHLGAAVMLCWAQLPLGTRDRILGQADDVIGFAPIAQVRSEIVKLMLRHAKARFTLARR